MSKSLQETYNTIAAHLMTQGVRSTKTNRQGTTSCRYWNQEEDTKCAVGCLIDTEHYNEKLEGRKYDASPVLKALRDSGYDTTDKDFIGLLYNAQGIHDVFMPEEWPERIIHLAVELSLTPYLHNVALELAA